MVLMRSPPATARLGAERSYTCSKRVGAYTRGALRSTSEQLSIYSAQMVTTRKATAHRHRADTSEAEHLTLMADLFAMLSDESRLRILMLLQDHDEVCVGDLAEWTGISESAVSTRSALASPWHRGGPPGGTLDLLRAR